MKDPKKPWEGPWGITSLYNWADEVRSKQKIPEKVELYDIIFRDGEQSTIGCAFNKKDYIDIASALSDWGLHRIEVMPAVSPENYAAAKEMTAMGLKSKIYAFCRSRRDDVQAAIDTGCDGITLEMSPSMCFMLGRTLEWGVKAQLDASRFAKEGGMKVTTFQPIAATTPFDVLSKFISDTIEYADAYCPVDSSGVCTPEGTIYFTDKCREIAPERVMECHPHNLNCMGTANAITAVAHGASVVHVETLGFTLPPAQEVAINLRTMLGIDTGVKIDKTMEVCKLISERAKLPIALSRPYIGERAYVMQVGIADHAWLNVLKAQEEALEAGKPLPPSPMEAFDAMARFVGRKSRKTIGKQSGRWSMNMKLWCMGIPEVSYEDAAKLLEKVEMKMINDKSYEVSDEDFLKIYEEVMGHPPQSPDERKIPEIIKRFGDPHEG